MIPLLAASLLLSLQGKEFPSALPTTVPSEVKSWSGFKYLPVDGRRFAASYRVGADWSGLKETPATDAVVWRTKVVILNRVDRTHERGKGFVWPGHHGILPSNSALILRALSQLRALATHLSGGALNLKLDVSEENEVQTIEGGDMQAVAAHYLEPRINGGRYQAEDGLFRGPYQSVLVVHPVGGESADGFEVQETPVNLIGLPDALGGESDGGLAIAIADRWIEGVRLRAHEAGLLNDSSTTSLPLPPGADWTPILHGADDSTEERLKLLGAPSNLSVNTVSTSSFAVYGEHGPLTTLTLVKDATRGEVLSMREGGAFRGGGFDLPRNASGTVSDVTHAPTLSFWMKSDALDPIVVGLFGHGAPPRSVAIGRDVAFAYDGAWHRVKIDLRPFSRVERIAIAPEAESKSRVRNTIGPIVALFADFEASTEGPGEAPTSSLPSPTSVDPEERARWASTAEPGANRRPFLLDRLEAVRANAVASALALPDPADEPMLIEDALYTFEPTVFSPAIRALANARTPTAEAALRQALRIAASDRARGFAAEILAERSDEKVVPLFIGLNQARSRAARISAVRALGKIPGKEAALMRMAYLAQDEPDIKLEATKTADPNDDYQGRKLLWSAVNEPSDAVRLESLKRLSSSTNETFRAEGLKGIQDDSVGVRAGLLDFWGAIPNPAADGTIRAALTDPEPRVRAAAVVALASSERLDAKEVPFGDSDPRVQFQVLRLASAKGFTVPSEVRDRWRKSPDPLVRRAAG